ncbi:hypothetical protein MNBD_ALPHA11-318 [hydrothermal vent metagenome]|uniref:Uncharacterized protein n=1 Tax=hydrothermal vent metagenome TaxID=652676 RepID=A0A3B0U2P9_9ZZZZ
MPARQLPNQFIIKISCEKFQKIVLLFHQRNSSFSIKLPSSP